MVSQIETNCIEIFCRLLPPTAQKGEVTKALTGLPFFVLPLIT